MYASLIILKKAEPVTRRDVVLNTLECDILVCLAEGCDIEEAVSQLCRAYDTIDHRISDLYDKTGFDNHKQLAKFAVAIGLIKYENGKVVRLIYDLVVLKGWKL